MSALALLAAAGAAPILLAQVQIEQHTVIRVRAVESPQPERVKWEERKGPKCIQANALAATLVSSPATIDLLLRGGARMRLRLGRSCPSIDFYSGFYVKPNKDGRICEDRDLIHARSGGECQIDQFRLLVPTK